MSKTFDYPEAVRRLLLGEIVQRLVWECTYDHLVFHGDEPKRIDLYRGVFWDLTSADLAATDWINVETDINLTEFLQLRRIDAKT